MRWIRLLAIAGAASLLAIQISAAPGAVERAPRAATPLPLEPFTRAPARPHDPADLVFQFDQLDYYYRVPGEFSHRLTGDRYGFDALSFIVTETHPGGGPGLHVHDTEEAHVLLAGDVQYRIGDRTFTVHGPYVARVPAGVPHTFRNVGTSPFNLVAVFSSKHPTTRRIGPNPLIPAPSGTGAAAAEAESRDGGP